MRTLPQLVVLRGLCKAAETTASAAAAAVGAAVAVRGEDDRLARRQNMELRELIRCDRLPDAMRLFRSLPSRNTVTWNIMIAALARNGRLVDARRLFDEMPHRDLVSHNTLLSGYASFKGPAGIDEAQRFFDSMPKRDEVSWNTMINGYARSGRMGDALRLFDEMPARNVVSWNTMITGFLRAGDVRGAVELYDRMPARDAASLNALVSGLIENGCLDEAKQVMLDGRKIEGIGCAVVDAFNTLIVGYGRRGKVDEARQVFDTLPDSGNKLEKNVISWNSMIWCYVKEGDIASAEGLFKQMPERDVISWNTMIAGYVQSQNVEEAMKLFWQMPEPDSVSWNSIVCGLVQSMDFEQARWFFQRMPCKNRVSWNTMIAGHEKNGDYDKAMELFSQMQASGERPDWHTLSSVLSACAGLTALHQGMQTHQLIVKTLVADLPISNALITMYSRCGCLSDAKAIFDEVKSQREVVSWNAMIGGYAQHGFPSEALNLFAEMKRTSVSPTHITFVSVLNACGHAGLVEEGRRLFDSMVKEFGIMPRVEHYASLVDLISRHGQVEDAMDVINGMVVPPDKAVWGALLGGCKVHKNVELARIAVEALVSIEPESSGPYVLLHNLLVDQGRWDDASEVREKMEMNNIIKHPGYSCLINSNYYKIIIL